MKRKILNSLFFIMALCSILSITSCSKDDDNSEIEQNTANYFYGKWKSTFSSGYQIYEFKSDGTFSMSEVDYESDNYTETGHWSFNTSTSTLIMTWDDDDDYTDKLKIEFMGDNKFKILPEDEEDSDDWGDGGILTRQ